MKAMSATIISLLVAGTQAMAAGNGASNDELGFMATLFIGFGVLILIFQTVPAIILLAGMAKGLFAAVDKKPADANTTGNSKSS